MRPGFFFTLDAIALGNRKIVEMIHEDRFIHALKPIDEDIIVDSVAKTKSVVTVEEHSRYGGLFSAIAEILAERCPAPIRHVAIEYWFGEFGQYEDILAFCGLTVEHILRQVQRVLEQKTGGGYAA